MKLSSKLMEIEYEQEKLRAAQNPIDPCVFMIVNDFGVAHARIDHHACG